MDSYTAIRIRALRSVVVPDKDYLIRKILRWYSKTFFTPMKEVEEVLPLDVVLQAYFEERYEAMTPADLDEEKAELLLSPEERQKRIMAEEAEEAELLIMGRLVAAEAAAHKKAQTKKGLPQAPGPKPVIASMGELPDVSPPPMRDSPSDLPAAKIPPGIEMKFVEDDSLEKEIMALEALAEGRK